MQTIWKDKMYTYGYLMTTDTNIKKHNIGIEWEKWNYTQICEYNLYTHPTQTVYVYSDKGISLVLVGHAYNPFTMVSDETDILHHLHELYTSDKEEYRDYFDQLTGMFFYAVIENNRITVTSDCAGMLATYYAKVENNIYFSSYSQLIADICGLNHNEYIKNMKKSKLFRLYGWFLPGDASPYDGIYRVIPNTEVIYNNEFECNRFYPRKAYQVKDDYESRVQEAGRILHNNMELILQKWSNPAISLTGGMDSQTTLACTSDVQNKYKYFSYISLDREATDANAAHSICERKNLLHTIYNIETNKDKVGEFDEVDRLIERHYSYIGKGNENDVCKRISLSKLIDCDVEVKSWVSEVVRASRYKMYGKKKMPKKITPRRLTTMYKVFAFNRKDARETDRRFADYMKKTQLRECVENNNYPWTEFFVWEIVFGGWGSLALTGEHRLTNDITIPYNNRALLDLMLRTPLEYRMTDQLNKDIIRFMDKELADMNVHVVNGNETRIREIGEKVYFEVHSRLPF